MPILFNKLDPSEKTYLFLTKIFKIRNINVGKNNIIINIFFNLILFLFKNEYFIKKFFFFCFLSKNLKLKNKFQLKKSTCD